MRRLGGGEFLSPPPVDRTLSLLYSQFVSFLLYSFSRDLFFHLSLFSMVGLLLWFLMWFVFWLVLRSVS